MSCTDIQKVNITDLAYEDRGRLVSAFEWLLKQDKKQNPAIYQEKNRENDRHSVPANP